MKFSIQQSVFHKALSQVNRAVSTTNTMPILSGILFEGDKDGNLTLTATDLELGIVLKMGANVESPGRIVLPGNELSSIVRELPRDIINVDIDQENYSAEITTKTSNFVLRGFKPDEFPELPEVENVTEFSLSTDDLKNIIDKVKFSCSSKDTKPGLTGALLTVSEDSIVMVATNTFRMAYYNKEMDLNVQEQSRAIIPSSTLDELSRLIDGEEDSEIKVVLDSSHCRFINDDMTVTSRLIEGKFPNYEQVMPNDFSAEIIADRNDLKNAVKRVSTIAKLDSNVIELDFSEDSLIIESTASEKGHGKEEVNVEFSGKPQKIKIDASYMMDGLKVLDEDEVRMELIGPVNPLTLKNPSFEDYIYLIMPIRPDNQ